MTEDRRPPYVRELDARMARSHRVMRRLELGLLGLLIAAIVAILLLSEGEPRADPPSPTVLTSEGAA